ncbi:hypothetical protein L9F63_013277 [Diploptera punctata]|uniref:Protein YIPF3 n=1 Tax=Diploptera punctata TaxID=6984 RepID=A0AAD8EN05_DIPPU|nr:hypothetical protein L9F63_013277 [Diploptera punctata]
MAGGKNCSVIFIGNDYTPTRSIENVWNGNKTNWPIFSSIKHNFMVPPGDLPRRMFLSFIPPIGERYRHVHVDFVGPSIALLLMAGMLHYGHASKLPSSAANRSPTEVLLLYTVFMPIAVYILGRLAKAVVTFTEMFALLGYGLFGHVFTFAVSLLFCDEESNVFFFLCLTVFGGLSALRVALVLLASIPVPAARLLVCSFTATVQLLSLVFLHFAYMHRTFVYGAAAIQTATV